MTTNSLGGKRLLLALAFAAACSEGRTYPFICETSDVEISASEWSGADAEAAVASLMGSTPITVHDGSGQRSGVVNAELIGTSYWRRTALEGSNYCGASEWSEAHLDVRWTVTTDDGALNQTWSDADAWLSSGGVISESAVDAPAVGGDAVIGADGPWASVDPAATFYVLSVRRDSTETSGKIEAYYQTDTSDTSEVRWTW